MVALKPTPTTVLPARMPAVTGYREGACECLLRLDAVVLRNMQAIMKRFFYKFAVVLLNAAVIWSLTGESNATDGADRTGPDPLNTTYRIEGQPIALVNGHHESLAAPGSATRVKTALWKQPVFGDLDGDGDEDAALLLTQDPGGSGTFYYVAAAVNADGRHIGTDTVLLGDRIVATGIEIINGRIAVNYTDRRPAEPMRATPSVSRTMALMVQHGQLLASTSPGDIEDVTPGSVIIGHEVRSFRPCEGHTDWWLMGQSPALKAIFSAYRQAVPDQEDYRPVFMVLAGKPVEPPAHGFGAEFDGAFLATRLVRVAPGARCTN